MYTNLPYNRLIAGVRQDIGEAYHTQSMRYATADSSTGYNLAYDNKGKCRVDFSFDAPHTLGDVLDWAQVVVDNTYIKNGDCPEFLQRYGIPMGGKCSSELAELCHRYPTRRLPS